MSSRRIPVGACCYYWWPAHSCSYQLPLVKCEAETLVQSTATRTLLRQTFKNPKNFAIPECTYQFPLYDGVALVGFKCHVDDRVIDGIVKEKEEARADYEAAVAQGEQAALLEQSQSESDVFRTSIGNLAADGTVVVEITYISELKHDTETDSLRFEMPTAIAPRYGGDSSFSNAPISRFFLQPSYHHLQYHCQTNEIPATQGFTWTAKIQLQSSILKVESPTHPVSLTLGRFEESDTEVSLDRARADLHLPDSSGLSSEFVLLIKAKGMDQPVALLEQHDQKPNQCAIMASLVPKFNLRPIRPEVVFVCDRSGSMAGSTEMAPIRLAANALKIMVHSLSPGVKFNVFSFGTGFEALFQKSEAYSKETLARATALADNFQANLGGTETFRAIQHVIENRWGDIPLEIILLTDGDIHRQEELFTYLDRQIAATKGQIRVFPLGIGSGVSTALIEGVARAGNGFAQMVQSGERMEQRCVRMLKAAMSPHVLDYKLQVLYEDGLPDDDDFEIVEPPAYHDAVSTREKEAAGKPTISLFDQDVDADQVLETTDTLPEVPHPSFMQAPARLPALYAFSRTTAYLLLSDEALSKRPRAVLLHGSYDGANLEIEIPIQDAGKGKTIHQFAARKISQDLEEGRAWFHNAKVNGKSLKDRYPSKIDDIVKREAVRLGTGYQIMNRWCSFVAVDRSKPDAAEKASGTASTSTEPGNDGGNKPLVFNSTRSKRRSEIVVQSAAQQPQRMAGRRTADSRWSAPLQRLSCPGSSKPFAMPSGSASAAYGSGAPVSRETFVRPSGSASTAYGFGSPAPPSAGNNPSAQQMQGSPPRGIFKKAKRVASSSGSALFGIASASSSADGASSSAGGTFYRPGDSSSYFGSTGGTAFGNSSPAPLPPPVPVPRSTTIGGRAMIPGARPRVQAQAQAQAPAQQQYFSPDDSFTASAFRPQAQQMYSMPDESFTASRPAPLNPVQRLRQIIALQDFEGFWSAGYVSQLASLTEQDPSVFQMVPGMSTDPWVTAVIVAYLEKKMIDEKGTWELVVDKARDWLDQNAGGQADTLLQQAFGRIAA